MQLNVDCVRDVLIQLEKADFNETTYISTLTTTLSSYSEEDIIYTCLKLYEAGFITADVYDINGFGLPVIKYISDITYEGHQFLADIHSDTIWNGAKNVALKVGINSLNGFSQIVTSIVSILIKNHFNL